MKMTTKSILDKVNELILRDRLVYDFRVYSVKHKEEDQKKIIEENLEIDIFITEENKEQILKEWNEERVIETIKEHVNNDQITYFSMNTNCFNYLESKDEFDRDYVIAIETNKTKIIVCGVIPD